jgi:glycosyltransferase involved in cell wall biosynthesis
MNLLLLDQFSELGGAQICLLDLLPAIRERGWRAVIAAPGQGPLLERAAHSGVIAEHLKCSIYSRGTKSAADVLRFLIDVPRLRAEIRRLVAKHHIDFVYVNGPRLALPAVWAVGRSSPLAYHCHSFVPAPYGSLLVGRWLRAAGAAVIANSRFAAKSLGSDTKADVIYNGVPDHARPRVGRHVKRIGIIGRIAPAKGQLAFVEAAWLLHQSERHLEFEICGSVSPDDSSRNYGRALRQQAEGLPVAFTGWTDDIASVLARLDVLVVPSVGLEATTRVILEAYSAGVLVVARNTGGIPEVLEHGRTGILVDDPDPGALARAVDELLQKHASEQCEMRRRSRELWQSRFTLERYQQDIIQLIVRCKGDFEASQKHAEKQG